MNNDFLEEKLSNDLEVSELLKNNSDINLEKLISDAKEIKRMLHIKEHTDKKIIEFYDSKIIVPEGSENTLIRELEEFNYEMYGDDLLTREDIYFNLIEDERNNKEDLSEKETLSDEIEESEIKNVLDEDEEKFKDFDIIVNNEEEKTQILEEVQEIIKDGKYSKLKLSRPLSITTRRFNKKIKSIKQNFIDSYGSVLFSKVSDWIIEEQNLYENLDRIDRIQKYKENKIKLQNKIATRSRLKRFFSR